MALIELDGVDKRVKTRHGVIDILKDVSFSVDNNDFVAIVGPSGCGKSTLLRLIDGLDSPSQGKIQFKGRTVTDVSHEMAMVFQSFALYPWLNVFENVTLGLEARGMEEEAIRSAAERYISVMGLEGFEDAYPRELSGGMRQRVGLARALIVEPTVLLMDEPFSSLDPLTAEALREEVLQLWREPTLPPDAVLLVTHNIEEALLMANRLIIISNRPGTVLAGVPVKLPRPRDRKSEVFYEMVDYVYSLITEKRESKPPASGSEAPPSLSQ